MTQPVLILCTGNSARSQMAEGLLRVLAADQFAVFSAGSKPSIVNPLAIAAMDERGIDIRSHRSKHLNEYLDQPFDYVITVCDNFVYQFLRTPLLQETTAVPHTDHETVTAAQPQSGG